MDLRKKIREEIQGAFKDGCNFADGYDSKIKSTVDGRTDSILEVVEKSLNSVCRDEFNNYTESAEEIEEKILSILKGGNHGK